MNQTEQIIKVGRIKELLKIYENYVFTNTGVEIVLIPKGNDENGEHNRQSDV